MRLCQRYLQAGLGFPYRHWCHPNNASLCRHASHVLPHVPTVDLIATRLPSGYTGVTDDSGPGFSVRMPSKPRTGCTSTLVYLGCTARIHPTLRPCSLKYPTRLGQHHEHLKNNRPMAQVFRSSGDKANTEDSGVTVRWKQSKELFPTLLPQHPVEMMQESE